MSAAERVFAEAEQSRRDTLRMLWPELHDVLAGPAQTKRPRPCEGSWCSHVPSRQRPLAAGRPAPGSPAMCPGCLGRAGKPASADWYPLNPSGEGK